MMPEEELQDNPENPAEETAPEPKVVVIEEHLDWKDKALRAQAEMQNMRRRAEEETETRTRRRMEGFFHELITVADHMDLALSATPESMKTSPEGENFLMGMQAIQASLDMAFRSQGVQFIEPKGTDNFDPELHEAVGTDSPQDTLEMVRRGYRLGNQILRPAQVHLPEKKA
ncbi:MAG: nucleotide exchange factor GrpE [Planctomycetota bacterium]|nr:nucleotide exchange factor GrpE [Planctomycetota bacterium]